MPLRDLTARLLQYNLWANERLTSWLLTLDRTILYQHTSSSFGTIDRTLQHILAAQIYWHEIIFREQINEFSHPVRENAVVEIIDELVTSSRQLVDDHFMLREQQLVENIKASDSTQPRYEYMLHVVNHCSYHRGQIVTLCRVLGVKGAIPVTDYDGYLWCLENT